MSLTLVCKCDVKGCKKKVSFGVIAEQSWYKPFPGWTTIGRGKFKKYFCPDCSKLTAVKELIFKQERGDQ